MDYGPQPPIDVALKNGEPNPISFDAPVRMKVFTPDGLIIETVIAMNQTVVVTTPIDGGHETRVQFHVEPELMPKGPKLVRDEATAPDGPMAMV